MRNIVTFIFPLVLILLFFTLLSAQTAGDYRTKASGDWSRAQNWERFNGSVWGPIGSPPNGSETITVQSADSIFVNIAVSITGTLVNQGVVEDNDILTIANGGTYQHDRDAGRVPIVTWEEGSTMLITGVTSTPPSDRDQNYYNLTFNTPGLLSNLNMDLDDNTIGGDIHVINTGYARWYLTSVLATDTAIVTINFKYNFTREIFFSCQLLSHYTFKLYREVTYSVFVFFFFHSIVEKSASAKHLQR